MIVQVRPFGDAIYKSKYFPWSKYISGKQGRNPGFDPLKIMVEVAHDNDMKIEAWVNPYRVTTGSTNYKKLAKNNQARNGMPRSLQEEMYYLMVEVCITTHPKKRSEH